MVNRQYSVASIELVVQALIVVQAFAINITMDIHYLFYVPKLVIYGSSNNHAPMSSYNEKTGCILP